jgi:hypothetical protein
MLRCLTRTLWIVRVDREHQEHKLETGTRGAPGPVRSASSEGNRTRSPTLVDPAPSRRLSASPRPHRLTPSTIPKSTPYPLLRLTASPPRHGHHHNQAPGKAITYPYQLPTSSSPCLIFAHHLLIGLCRRFSKSPDLRPGRSQGRAKPPPCRISVKGDAFTHESLESRRFLLCRSMPIPNHGYMSDRTVNLPNWGVPSSVLRLPVWFVRKDCFFMGRGLRFD